MDTRQKESLEKTHVRNTQRKHTHGQIMVETRFVMRKIRINGQNKMPDLAAAKGASRFLMGKIGNHV